MRERVYRRRLTALFLAAVLAGGPDPSFLMTSFGQETTVGGATDSSLGETGADGISFAESGLGAEPEGDLVADAIPEAEDREDGDLLPEAEDREDGDLLQEAETWKDGISLIEETEADPAPDLAGPDLEAETEIAKIQDPLNVPDQIGASGTRPASGRRRSRRAVPSYAPTALFADQLGPNARAIYDSKVSWYVEGHHKASEKWECILDKNQYSFQVKMKGVTYDEGAGKYVWKASPDMDDPQSKANKDDAKSRLEADMQAAADAFKHDHPEAFWIRSPGTYSITSKPVKESYQRDQDGNAYATYYFASTTYEPVEAFSGASSRIDEYEAGLQAAVSQVREMAAGWKKGGSNGSETKDGPSGSKQGDDSETEDRALLVRAADQYLSRRLSYDSTSLSEAVEWTRKEGRDIQCHDVYRIYTSAAAFLPEGGSLTHGAVCEGYAKALKVLLDRLEIPSVLVAGLADRSDPKSGHMWNAVKVGDSWYLTDPTWDDGSDIGGKYLLVSDYTNNTDLKARVASGNFSGSAVTTVFSYPAMSQTCYRTSHRTQSGPTDLPEGSLEATCYVCGASYKIEREAEKGSGAGEADPDTDQREDSQKGEKQEGPGRDSSQTSGRPTAPGEGRMPEDPQEPAPGQDDRGVQELEDDQDDPEAGTDPGSGSGTGPATGTGTGSGTGPATGTGTGSGTGPATGIGTGSDTGSAPGTGTAGGPVVQTGPETPPRPQVPVYQEGTVRPQPAQKAGQRPSKGQTKKKKGKPALKRGKISKIKAGKKGRFTVTFQRVGACRTYKVQYATSKSFRHAKTKKVTSKKKKISLTIKGKRKKTYYVRVRAVSGKKAGAWSKVRKVKTR